MKRRRHTSLKSLPALEVVDSRNTPICIMNSREVARQGLRHRMVALILRDTAKRMLLSCHTETTAYNFSSFAPVYAGQSYEACAQNILQNEWSITSKRLLFFGIYPPCPENRHTFTAIFEVRLRTAQTEAIAQNMERHLLLDHDELKGLTVHCKELLAPFIRVALQNGYIRRPR
ncbi:MAG: NUDIX hydrolase [Desulfovibrio sp.]|jgi:isopentenyl-diphosphate delta-isomerase|nr:NUDIX hydrolase [Desulfovibrio sp.]